jgi:hypothetical protein
MPGIWPGSVEVSDALHNQILSETAAGRVLSVDEDGHPVTVAKPAEPELPFEQLVSNTFFQLNADYEHAVTLLRDTYPFAETTTWPVQIAEAKTYDAWRNAGSEGTAPLTPFLSDLTAARTAQGVGNGLVDLIDRVLHNDSIYSPAVAFLTATRHATEKALLMAHALNDIDTVKTMTWSFAYQIPVPPTA